MKNNPNNRREFLKKTSKAGLAAGLSFTVLPSLAKSYAGFQNRIFSAEEVTYEQQPLGYSYGSLEPVIDAMTMEIHYSKHAASYAKNLGDAVKAEGVNTATQSLVSVMQNISKYSSKMRNNGGGHYNHEFFWKSMKVPTESNSPQSGIMKSIISDFGSFEALKTKFADAGKTRFGSGWAWLIKTSDNKLIVSSTANQDNPLMDICDVKGTPLLGLDVWEHAYYLKYQNRRPDYINAWWNVVDWKVVQQRFNNA